MKRLVRANIKNLSAYSSARHEFNGAAGIFLDANENSFGSPLPKDYNRYPDPFQTELKEKIGSIKGLAPQNIFLGNGSDEAIDLLFRIFCEPGKDNVIIFPPTYGMYETCAAVNNVMVKKVPLQKNFQLNIKAALAAVERHTKMVFICSPNNPTGNSIRSGDIRVLLGKFDGLVIIDEAYIHYARQKSFIPVLSDYPNLVILQTLSKAWGMAGLRLGMAFAGEPVINYLNKVKYPYNINTVTQQLMLKALKKNPTVNKWTKTTINEREKLSNELKKLVFTQIVYTSDANFILVKITEARKVYKFLAEKGIVVRDRSKLPLCDDCLRITIGTPEENRQLIDTLKSYCV